MGNMDLWCLAAIRPCWQRGWDNCSPTKRCATISGSVPGGWSNPTLQHGTVPTGSAQSMNQSPGHVLPMLRNLALARHRSCVWQLRYTGVDRGHSRYFRPAAPRFVYPERMVVCAARPTGEGAAAAAPTPNICMYRRLEIPLFHIKAPCLTTKARRPKGTKGRVSCPLWLCNTCLQDLAFSGGRRSVISLQSVHTRGRRPAPGPASESGSRR